MLNPEQEAQIEAAKAFHIIDPIAYALKTIDVTQRLNAQYREEFGELSTHRVMGADFADQPDSDRFLYRVSRGMSVGVDRNGYLDRMLKDNLVPIISIQERTPEPIRNYFAASGLREKLTDASSLDATREVVANFLIEHNKYSKDKAAKLEPVVESTRQQVLERIPELVRAGKLPKSALERLEIVKTIPVNLTDAIDARDLDALLGGYYDNETFSTYLSVFWPEHEADRIVAHELTHVLSGSAVTENGMKMIKTPRVGLAYDSLEGEHIGESENEAITEIIANLILHPNMSVKEAVFHGNIYSEERQELWVRYGGNDSALKALMDAYFTNDMTDQDKTFEQKYIKAEQLAYKSRMKLIAKLAAAGSAVVALGVSAGVAVKRRKR